jgi:xanthine dehydrogenase accessory factor
VFLEPVGVVLRLFVFGAGHVGRAVAALAATVGFSVVLVDDRREYLGPEGLPAGVMTIEADPTCFGQRLDVGADDYVLVASRGHSLDLEWLVELVPVRPRYVGMLGSRKKSEGVRRALSQRGVVESDIDRLHAPVGLSIGADTPEEIAVSILAEMIKERRMGGSG